MSGPLIGIHHLWLNNLIPDGTTILPWWRGKLLASDVTVPDMYADAHVSNTATGKSGPSASVTSTNKTNKCSQLSETHIFTPMVIETTGTRHHQAVELVQELGRRATIITGDSRETAYMFQQLSVAMQKENAVSFQNTFTAS